MEYYELRKLYEIISSKKQNPFVPRYPFKLLIAGTSESGKMSMVVHLLLGSKYSKIYLWMSDEKCDYKIPKDGSKNFVMNKQAPLYENVRFKLITPKELPNILSFKKTD
ncbi:hypothetical protein Glove_22g82 [Diversispora epigaea]|uniref:Uncharacterized protein n=1 Tax=Diversispora epigaea TaxID=1348612 RepID=A0A397JP16_9GLOM|nr:hypothetical protein Glove_22g82 [Diversispora epigaea]